MLVQALFASGLLVGIALATWQRCPLLIRSALVLFGNFIACQLAVATTGTFDPVAMFAVIDVASAVVLLWQPAGRTQAAIGAVYLMQLALHLVQWPGGVLQNEYVSVLTVAGGCQIGILLLGAIDHDGRKRRSSGDWRSDHHRAVAHGGVRLEKGQRP